jgi:hypothetical protein
MAVNVAWLTQARSHIMAADIRRRMRASFKFWPRITRDFWALGISNVLFCFKTTISSFDLMSYILAFIAT